MYICPNRSSKERKGLQEACGGSKTEAKFKYTEPDKVHIIKNNKFVSLERKHEPAQTRPI